jgi:hypothetical protein
MTSGGSSGSSMISESDTSPCTVDGLKRSYRTVTYHYQRWVRLR